MLLVKHVKNLIPFCVLQSALGDPEVMKAVLDANDAEVKKRLAYHKIVKVISLPKEESALSKFLFSH